MPWLVGGHETLEMTLRAVFDCSTGFEAGKWNQYYANGQSGQPTRRRTSHFISAFQSRRK